MVQADEVRHPRLSRSVAMRALFTCIGGYGHFHPMVPLAQEMERAGHGIAFATSDEFCPRVEVCGFEAFPAGISSRIGLEEFFSTTPEFFEAPVDQRLGIIFPKMFGAIDAPPMYRDLRELVREWKPGILIHETAELAGGIVAEAAGIRHVEHSFGTLLPQVIITQVIDAVTPLLEDAGVTHPGISGSGRAPYLDIVPPTLQSTEQRQVASRQFLRPVPFDAAGDDSLPSWIGDLPERPTIYATLGTVNNRETHVFRAILEGLRDEDYNLIVTVGKNIDPEIYGPQPDNVHVEHYIPQSQLLIHCDAVVTHGGSGSTLASLGHGLPMLILPRAADQFFNAERCLKVGAALRLMPDEVTPEAIRGAMTELLADPSYVAKASHIQDEIEAMPGPAEVVAVLAAT